MGSDGAQSNKIPTINLNEIKNLTPGTDSWNSTSESVRAALESYGCLVLTCDEMMSSDLYNGMFGMMEQVFDLPLETKNKHTCDLAGFGYGGTFSTMPLFEYFGIEDDGSFQVKKDFTNLMWPQGHHKFCETLDSYCKLLVELEEMVLKMVASSYNLEKYYDPLIRSRFYMTRLMKYRSPGENGSGVGILPHRDKSFMGVISTNEVKGLQIETRDGDWIDFHPSRGNFIIVVGEPLMAWSNGRIYSPLHKVIARGAKVKYSIGLFSFIREILEVPSELVDDQNPLKFKPFYNLEFLDYCKEGGTTLETAIKAYCGL